MATQLNRKSDNIKLPDRIGLGMSLTKRFILGAGCSCSNTNSSATKRKPLRCWRTEELSVKRFTTIGSDTSVMQNLTGCLPNWTGKNIWRIWSSGCTTTANRNLRVCHRRITSSGTTMKEQNLRRNSKWLS